MLEKLPLDLSTFSEIRKKKYLYVDKTEYAYNLITTGRRFFLSRPRRFGKTLFVSILKEIFSGNKDLFNDLWISKSDYTWQQYGLINLDLSEIGVRDSHTLKNGLNKLLVDIANKNNIEIESYPDQPELTLRNLAKKLKSQFGHVALLIDEYDFPILHSLSDIDLAKEIRDSLSIFFSAIKALDTDIDFVFITGVSSFAKADLFSGLNNLRIISLDEKYSGICGYNEKELDSYFYNYINEWSEKAKIDYSDLRNQIKTWYNGYRFSKNAESVYNPFSVMNALENQEFKIFWFRSGTPTFLINMLKKEYKSFDPEKLEVTESSLEESIDFGSMPIKILMFQSGYLTIENYNKESRLYKLGYPNLEVKVSFQKYLLEIFANLNSSIADRISQELYVAFNTKNIPEVIELLRQLFSNVPYQLHINAEKYYHSLLIMAFTAAGIKICSEHSTADGRIDLVLDLPNYFYTIEVKFNESAENAIKQIKERQYFKPFLKCNKPIILLGLSFHREPSQFSIDCKFEEII